MMWWSSLMVSALLFHPPFSSRLVFRSLLPKSNHNEEGVGAVWTGYFLSVSTYFTRVPNDLGRCKIVQELEQIPGLFGSSRVDFPKFWHLGPWLKLAILPIVWVGATYCWRGVPKSWILDTAKFGLISEKITCVFGQIQKLTRLWAQNRREFLIGVSRTVFDDNSQSRRVRVFWGECF